MGLRRRLARAEQAAAQLTSELVLPDGTALWVEPTEFFAAVMSLLEEKEDPHPLAKRILELDLDGPVPDTDPFVNIVLMFRGSREKS